MKNNANNQNAIKVKRILDGEIGCSTYNMRICFFEASKKEYEGIKACMQEVEEKMSPEQRKTPSMQECIEEFKEKIGIYERFFRELSRREAAGIA